MFEITREIGVDYGHRVCRHKSACKNIHGHRAKIEVTCRSVDVHHSGEQTDMVLDFSFLKTIMMEEIHTMIDHGFICELSDVDVMKMFAPDDIKFDNWYNAAKETVKNSLHKCCATTLTKNNFKFYVVDFSPTAERLAEHFFKRLKEPVKERSNGLAEIVKVRFWETPNNYADYTEGK